MLLIRFNLALDQDKLESPVNVFFNGQPRETVPQTTVAALLEHLELNPLQLAVEVNSELVPRTRHAEFVLNEGDRIEVVKLVGGG